MLLYNPITDHPILDALRCFFKDNYGKEYTGELKLYHEDTSYNVSIGLNRVDRPMFIGGDFESDAQFTTYLLKEVKARNFPATKYFTLQVTVPDNYSVEMENLIKENLKENECNNK